jgi:hypothetical protein
MPCVHPGAFFAFHLHDLLRSRRRRRRWYCITKACAGQKKTTQATTAVGSPPKVIGQKTLEKLSNM